jgi:membrane-bound inhibitor of C-type lysozyme
MLTRLTNTARATLPLLAALAFCGCNGRQDAPPPAQVSGPAEAASEPSAPTTPAAATGEPSPADARMIAALPEGTYLYYAWDCDSGLHLVMKNLIQDRAVSLETHEGSRKLPQAVSASGVRYTDGTVTFWTKGDTATYQRAGGTLLNCRLAASGNTRP